MILCDSLACQQGVASPTTAASTKGLGHGHLSCPTWAVGHPARPGLAIPWYSHPPKCPLPSSASPPRPRHGKSRFIFIRAFVLSQCLHLVSIVCDVSVGRRRGLGGACYSARKHRPVGLRPAASLFPLYILPFSLCTLFVLGRSSLQAISGVFRVPRKLSPRALWS